MQEEQRGMNKIMHKLSLLMLAGWMILPLKAQDTLTISVTGTGTTLPAPGLSLIHI